MRVKFELALLWDVLGRRGLGGDRSLLCAGEPFGRLGSGRGGAGDPPSKDRSSTDLPDFCDWLSSPNGLRGGLSDDGPDSGVLGRPTNSDVDD